MKIPNSIHDYIIAGILLIYIPVMIFEPWIIILFPLALGNVLIATSDKIAHYTNLEIISGVYYEKTNYNHD